MGNDITLYTEAELAQVVQLDRAMIDLMEETFLTLAQGGVLMPPILSMDIHDRNAEVDVKTAYVPGMEGFAVKISPGFFNNPALGLASINGLMVYFSAETGMVRAVFLDNGYLTDIRTAAAGGLVARHLAPPRVETAGIFGTGVQARLQARAAHLERPFSTLLIHGRTPDHAADCAEDLARHFGDAVAVKVAEDAEAMVAASQLVVTTTPARDALIPPQWLHRGLHITAMGSDADGKQELAPEVLAAADVYCCDRLSQVETLGELQHVRAAGMALAAEPVELGDLVAAKLPRDENAITVADLTGTGAQDTAIASFAFAALTTAALKGQKLGTTVAN